MRLIECGHAAMAGSRTALGWEGTSEVLHEDLEVSGDVRSQVGWR